MKKMKKILAVVLSLALVMGLINVRYDNAKAADSYEDVTLTGTSGWDTSNDGSTWILYLTTSGTSDSSWGMKYKGFNIVVNGVEGTTGQISTVDGTKLYCTIPTSLVPTTDGTTFTIKAGKYEPDLEGQTTGINILNDLQVVVSEGRLVHMNVIDVGTAESFNNTASSFYFNLFDKTGNKITTGYSSWTNFLSPAWCDGTRVTQDAVSNQWSLTYSGVFVDGTPLNYWDAHFKECESGTYYIDGLSAVSGTTVTIKGMFASSTQADWTIVGNYFLKEFSFTYDGINWNFSRPAEYFGAPLTSTDGWNTSVTDGNWVLYLNTSNYTSTDWSKKYEGFTYEYNGVTGTTGQVSSAENNRLYCTIPTSAVPTAEGTTFTIKAGNYDSDATDQIDGIYIPADFDIVVNEGRLMHTTVLKPAAVEAFNSTASSFYFSLKDANGNGLATGCESWTNFLSPAWCDGTRVAQESWTSINTGVWVDGTPLGYWDAHFKNTGAGEFYIDGLSATNGTTIVVRGAFNSATQADWTTVGHFYLPELTFTYDGSTWSYVEPTDAPTYTEYTGTPVFNHFDTIGGFYFRGEETTFPYAENWSYTSYAEDDAESGVFLSTDGGESYTKTATPLKKVQENLWYVCLSDVSVVPTAGDIIMVKGAFLYDDVHRITFSEAKFTWDGSAYKAYEEPAPETQYTEGTITGFNRGAAPSSDGTRWAFYLNTSVTLLGSLWDDGGTYPMKVSINGGREFEATVKMAGESWLYMSIPTLGLSDEEDVTVTIKAGTYDKSAEPYGFILKEDFVFHASKYGWSTSDMIFSSNVARPTWMINTLPNDSTGFYVNVNRDDGVTIGDWDILYPLVTKETLTTDIWLKDELGGVWDEQGTHIDAEVKFQKLDATQIYVNVSSLGVTAETQATYVIGGLFYDEEHGCLIDYEPIKVVWDGTSWTQVSNPLADSGVDADVNSDGEVNLHDLIRMMRHQNNELVSINEEREDINYNGSVDEYDVRSLCNVLTGELYYRGEREYPQVPYGIPQFNEYTTVQEAFELEQTIALEDGSNNADTGDDRLIAATVSGAPITADCMGNEEGLNAYELTNAGQSAATITFTFACATGVLVYREGVSTIVYTEDGVYTCSLAGGESIVIVPIREEQAEDFVDFIVEVEEGRTPVVLQISDTQIIDSSQDESSVLNGIQVAYSAPERMNANCYDYLDELIDSTNPDLILMTGDLVYGKFDNNGSVFQGLVEYMESKEIPWAPVFGNHDNESAKGVDWQCEQLENAEYCLFEQRELTGNGNYTVGIKQGDEMTRVFFMLDSNGCDAASAESLANGHTSRSAGFGSDQVKWYTKTAEAIKEYRPDMKFSFVFHIQIAAFADAYAKYGFTNNGTKENPINIDLLDSQEEGDFGYLGRDLKTAWDSAGILYDGLKDLGVDSLFVGHEHCNSASVVYEGIRFQYGQKSSTYDRVNWLNISTGTVTGAECQSDSNLKPLVGGTVIPLTTDGTLGTPYIYMSGFENGVVDWESYQAEDITIAGLQYDGTNMYVEEPTVITVTADSIDGYNAWKCECTSQAKVYVKTDLLEGKSKFTFSAYVPTTSTNTMQLTDYPIFAIRVKTSAVNKPAFANCTDGHICYSTTTSDTTRLVEPGTWQTFTVDLTDLDTSDCTEFAFYVGTGNTIYIKDIVIE